MVQGLLSFSFEIEHIESHFALNRVFAHFYPPILAPITQ
jgi:hypothetical protein